MKRRQRTQLMIEHGSQATIQWAEKLANIYPITQIIEPRLGLMMIKQRETAQNTLFYSGEILMTECKVRFNDFIGNGLVTGDRPVLAYSLAILDLAFIANWPESQEINAWLEDLAQQAKKEQNAMIQQYQKSRVDFSTMNQ